jgi:hypothetical protein
MTDAGELRERAERLFALALQARDKGNTALADELTALAIECLESANEGDGGGDATTPVPPTARVVPQAQQQQQQQQATPEPDDDET